MMQVRDVWVIVADFVVLVLVCVPSVGWEPRVNVVMVAVVVTVGMLV